jgi:hypothetical protein
MKETARYGLQTLVKPLDYFVLSPRTSKNEEGKRFPETHIPLGR